MTGIDISICINGIKIHEGTYGLDSTVYVVASSVKLISHVGCSLLGNTEKICDTEKILYDYQVNDISVPLNMSLSNTGICQNGILNIFEVLHKMYAPHSHGVSTCGYNIINCCQTDLDYIKKNTIDINFKFKISPPPRKRRQQQ